MAYKEYATRLMGYVPKLSFPLALDLVNQAWRFIRERRAWSFLVAEEGITIPAAITTGTISITFGAAAATASGASKVAWDAITLVDPPITKRQLRVGNELYNITAYDSGTGVATLDRIIRLPTNSAITYSLYRCYISPPSADFLRFTSVVDAQQGFPLRLNFTRKELDGRDPQRTASGLAYLLAAYKDDGAGVPLYELWPHPTGGQQLIASYQRRGVAFSSMTDSLPPSIPEELLFQRALALACQWAQMNAGRHPELKGTDWRFSQAKADAEFEKLLQVVRKQDDERFLQTFTMEGVDTPIMDGTYLQSHPL